MNLQDEYTLGALREVITYLRSAPDALPPTIARAVALALTLVDRGEPSIDELAPFIGRNWVLARRTYRIVARYGNDVNCINHKQYAAAERAAVEARIPIKQLAT